MRRRASAAADQCEDQLVLLEWKIGEQGVVELGPGNLGGQMDVRERPQRRNLSQSECFPRTWDEIRALLSLHQ